MACFLWTPLILRAHNRFTGFLSSSREASLFGRLQLNWCQQKEMSLISTVPADIFIGPVILLAIQFLGCVDRFAGIAARTMVGADFALVLFYPIVSHGPAWSHTPGGRPLGGRPDPRKWAPSARSRCFLFNNKQRPSVIPPLLHRSPSFVDFVRSSFAFEPRFYRVFCCVSIPRRCREKFILEQDLAKQKASLDSSLPPEYSCPFNRSASDRMNFHVSIFFMGKDDPFRCCRKTRKKGRTEGEMKGPGHRQQNREALPDADLFSLSLSLSFGPSANQDADPPVAGNDTDGPLFGAKISAIASRSTQSAPQRRWVSPEQTTTQHILSGANATFLCLGPILLLNSIWL